MMAGKAMVRTWLTGFILLVATACGASEETPPKTIEYRLPTEVPHATMEPLAEVSVSGVSGPDGLLPVLSVLPTNTDHHAYEEPSLGSRVPATPAAQSPEVVVAAAGEPADWLRTAGWPENLIPQALRVMWCESRYSPIAVGDNGTSYGLFQVKALWFHYSGYDLNQWADPVVNASVGLATYRYDLSRGQAPWTQWSCGWAARE